MKLTRDDFEAWRHNPLTELILDRYVTDEMAKTRAMHDTEAWNGPLDLDRHAALRERFETLEWMKEISFDEVEEWMTQS
jgi:hypothetical protein